MSKSPGSLPLAVALIVCAIALALGNFILFAQALQRVSGAAAEGGALAALWERAPAYVVYLATAHLFIGAVAALIVWFFRQPAAAAPAAATATSPAGDAAAPGLRLLALLQSEARFVDFLEEDIDAYSDAQVGAAVRSIHAGCRKALHERMRIERIYAAEDGATIEVPPGFDPTAVRLTGNIHGQPPFRGTLQHGGWRAREVRLPASASGIDASVLAPAEVEIA